MIRRHPLVFGFVVALLFSVFLASPYLLQPGLKSAASADTFSGLPFLIERSSLQQQWGTFFIDWTPGYSEPCYFGDSNFFLVPHFVLYLITQNIVLSYKLLEIVLLTLAFFTMYLLAYHLSGKHKIVSGVSAGVFYSLTPYFLFELIHHHSLMFAYALLPFAFFAIIKAFTSERYKAVWVCVAGLAVAAATTWPSLEYIYVNGIFLVIFAVAYSFRGLPFSSFSHLRTSLKTMLTRRFPIVVVIFGIMLALSMYFVAPIVFTNGPFHIVSNYARITQASAYSNS
jgi:hypothetical protein